MVAIITDSSSNFSQEEAKALNVSLMPLTIIFGMEEFRDGVDIDCEEFYKKLTTGSDFPHTAQLSEAQIDEAVQDALKQCDEVLILPIAAALSGSYDRCVHIANKYNGVYVYETSCTIVMLKMLVLEAVANRTKSAEEIIKILDNLRPKIKLWAALDTLEYLGRGGRISKTVAKIGSVLKVKPVVTLNSKGEVELVSKQFGMGKALNFIADKVDAKKIDFSKPVYLIYTMNDANSQILADKIGAKYSEKCNICPVIGTHIGPDGAGFVYIEK